MKQLSLQKSHYEVFGFDFNPVDEDGFTADHKFICMNKREVVGILKVMLDNFDCEHISIFKIRGIDII